MYLREIIPNRCNLCKKELVCPVNISMFEIGFGCIKWRD